MLKTLSAYIGEYKKDSIKTPIYIIVEVLMEILIPFVTASIIDKGIQAGDMSKVFMYGGLMLVLAFISLFSGIQAGKYAASASTGFACNLREGIYSNIQNFAFSNIDKYSTAGLITRMTTDVTNVQNAYQMILRIAVRAPLMMICSMVMCFIINPTLSLIFLGALILLGFVLFFIIYKVTPIFTEGFAKYDDLNASVQENVTGIRVVKAFVREDHENKKFSKAAENLYKTFVKAESWLAFNNPIMMFVIYGSIIALSWFAAHFITDGTMTTGNLTSMFSYVMSMMMSLMMLSMIFVMVMCFIINPTLSLIFLGALILLGFVLFFIIYKVTPIFTEGFAKYDDLNASVQENVTGIRVVKAFVREDHENKKFSKAAENLYKTFVKAESWLAFNNPIMMFVIYGSIIALSWFAAHFITDGTMTTGNLTSMFSYVMSMMMSLMMLSMIFVMVSMSAASARRIAEVLNEKADITNPENPVMEVPDGRIDFNHVNFTYKKDSDKDALEDIDIHINAGETIGIIGGTGCGKSSFVNLISRLYDVKDGSVCVGGIDVRDYDLETLRNEVSVVLQKNVLFSGTILDNLRWGDENASEEDCIEACRQACADEFIERMPDKYNTWIEQGGSNVSGGQRQRLCIARALLKHPKVLILDDSTSAVDTATDAKIKKAFATKIPGTTKIIVSQRISSIQDADRILVLENGCVSGFDTHENLVENNKVYREIYEVQTQGGGDFDEAGE